MKLSTSSIDDVSAQSCPFPEESFPLLSGSLWGIMTYYNPQNYVNKRANLRIAADNVRRQGLNLVVVEATEAGRPFVIEDDIADTVIRVHVTAVLWMKERLINLAIDALPKDCDKVAWLDGDVLLEDDCWVKKLPPLLEKFAVVQLFSTAYWMGRSGPGHRSRRRPSQPYADVERVALGVAFAASFTTKLRLSAPGHVGFAWAARRSILSPLGLYDRFIIGGGDSIMALAALGAPSDHFLSIINTPKLAENARKWIAAMQREVNGSVTALDGAIYHLWHGDRTNRGYLSRYKILSEADFDPESDLRINGDGIFEWASNKPALHSGVRNYFSLRKEEQTPQ